MAQINQVSGAPLLDLTCKNTTGSDIAAGYAVILDTSNPPSSGTAPGITLPASDANAFGVTVDAIPNGKTGRVRVAGIAVCTSSATLHVGDYVETDSAGKVRDLQAGNYQLGICLGEAVSADAVAVLLAQAKNA